jgi:leucyl aminopeptidase
LFQFSCEIINTDAEGRLVLADALWYTQDVYKPRVMIDLATLTGAILVSLAHVHAGMFTNSDDLAAELKQAGKASGDSVWRMPIGDAYDRLIDSKFADMKNSASRGGGSSTAAQFLQRFTNKVPWCHLDIAGTAFGAPKTPTCQSWASGFGVKLMDRWVADHVED